MTQDPESPSPSFSDLPGLPRLFTIPQIAEYFGVSVRTVEGWNSAGTGPKPVKVGKHIRYTEDSIREFLESRTAG